MCNPINFNGERMPLLIEIVSFCDWLSQQNSLTVDGLTIEGQGNDGKKV